MADKFQAAIDAIEFDCETIEDSFEKSIARHEFPHRSGAILEDMGQRARVIRLRCYFLNERYENHKSLIDYIKRTDHEYELTHPKYGIIKGQVESMIVRHDDRQQTAEIDLTFVEELSGSVDTVSFSPSVAAGTEDAFIDGQDELIEVMEQDVHDQYPNDFEELLKEIDPTKSTLLEQYNNLTTVARSYVKTVDTYVGSLKKTLNEIKNPANSLVSTITYATNLPGVVIGTLAAAVERHALLYNTGLSAPERFLQSFRTGVAEIEDAFDDFGTYTRVAKSQREAVELGAILAEDQANDQAASQAAAVATFSVLGRLQKEISDTEPLLTITEIETALAIVRTDLQAAIDVDRRMQSLKTMAATLTDHVITIKKTKPPLVAVAIDNAMPLHLICLKYGLAYNEAAQILAINRIPNPNFTSGEVQIYVR
jgi:prophage DNA circulation protein